VHAALSGVTTIGSLVYTERLSCGKKDGKLRSRGYSKPMISRRQLLKTASVSLAAAVCPVPSLLADDGRPEPLEQFGYGDVQLAPGKPRAQFEQTQAVILGMNVDSLLKPFRLRAGQADPGPDMGGWYDEVPWRFTAAGWQGFCPGHAMGQWISALARGHAADRDPAKRKKIEDIFAGYGPAISGRFYTNFRFPAYVYDKVVCGLIDAHEFCGLDRDFTLLNRTTDAAEPHLPPHALDRDRPQLEWRASIGENTTDDYGWDEPYTLPENLFLAWKRGAGERYRQLAPRFLLDKTYFDPLASGQNVLAGHHAYSFCNALSSAAQTYFATGSTKHLAAASNGFDMINAQSYAPGGWGPDEAFRDPQSDDLYESLTKTHHSFETPCGSYAHFKLTRYLLRVTRDGRYGDSMERVLYNTVLGAKPLQTDGTAYYYSDYNFHGSKFYHSDKWPCCSGTLTQVAADYHILIYFRDSQGVYVNLYLPSQLSFTSANGAQFKLEQSGEYPYEGQVHFELRANKPAAFPLRLRIPAWAQGANDGAGIRVNGALVALELNKGFATVSRTWKDGDRIDLSLPMPARLEAIIPRHPDTVALVRGPLALFALAENPRVSREQLLSLKRGENGSWQAGGLKFKPFVDIEDERFTTYIDVQSA
jgi:DUF1680 family protein